MNSNIYRLNLIANPFLVGAHSQLGDSFGLVWSRERTGPLPIHADVEFPTFPLLPDPGSLFRDHLFGSRSRGHSQSIKRL